mmetsp:Transcript_136033/g.235973  ORF Transcript_136033/g.235973 Transcript_136033/m.235973 type:complete len:982 (-) Transcript_136033:939-3884(-)
MAQPQGPMNTENMKRLHAKIQEQAKSRGITDSTAPNTCLSHILARKPTTSRVYEPSRSKSGPKDIAEYEENLLNWAQKVPHHIIDPKFGVMTFLSGRNDAPKPVQRRLKINADDAMTNGALQQFASYVQNSIVEVFFRDNQETDIQFVFWADAQRVVANLQQQPYVYMPPTDLKTKETCLMLGGLILPGVLKYVKCLFSRIDDVKFSEVFSRDPSTLTTTFPSTILLQSDPHLKTFEHAHFCFIQFSKDDKGAVKDWPLLAALGNLQQRLLNDFELVLMVVPGIFQNATHTHFFSVEDYLRRYPQPSSWICPEVLGESAATGAKISKRRLVAARVHAIPIDQKRVELRINMGYGKKGYGDLGFIDRDEVSDELFGKLDDVVHEGQIVRVRILGQEDHDGYTWHRCSLKDASLLPQTNMPLDLRKKVRSLKPPEDWELIDAFDVIEGYVVEVGSTFSYLKVDIGYTEDFGYISAEGNQLTWQQVQNDYTVGTKVTARIHREWDSAKPTAFPSIELSVQAIDVDLKAKARSLAENATTRKLNHNIQVGCTADGVVVAIAGARKQGSSELDLDVRTAEVFIGIARRVFVPLAPAESSCKVGDLVLAKITRIAPLKLEGELQRKTHLQTTVCNILKQLSKGQSGQGPPPMSYQANGPGAVRVSNLASSVDDIALRNVFKKYATASSKESVKAQVDRDLALRHLGTATVYFDSKKDALDAVEKANGMKLGNQEVSSCIKTTYLDPPSAPALQLQQSAPNTAVKEIILPPSPKFRPAEPSEPSLDHYILNASTTFNLPDTAAEILDSYAEPKPPPYEPPPGPDDPDLMEEEINVAMMAASLDLKAIDEDDDPSTVSPPRQSQNQVKQVRKRPRSPSSPVEKPSQLEMDSFLLDYDHSSRSAQSDSRSSSPDLNPAHGRRSLTPTPVDINYISSSNGGSNRSDSDSYSDSDDEWQFSDGGTTPDKVPQGTQTPDRWHQHFLSKTDPAN